MKKNIIILVIYIILLLLIILFYINSPVLTTSFRCCWSEPCPEPLFNKKYVDIGCLIGFVILMFLIVKTIIRIIRSK